MTRSGYWFPPGFLVSWFGYNLRKSV